MNCNCYTEINAKLATQNLRLTGYTHLFPSFQRVPIISTEWIKRDDAPKGKKSSPTHMLASHCPFCGVKIKEEKPEALEEEESDLALKQRLAEEAGEHECDLTRAGD